MDKVIVGKIVNTHGIKGELKIQRTNEEPFDRDVNYYIEDFNESYNIEKSRKKGLFTYIKLKGFDNINDVLKFKSKNIYVEETDLYKLDQDEYFIKDLIGLEVYNTDGSLVGKLVDVLTYAANDVYVISTNDGTKDVPAVKEFVKEINIEKKTMVIEFIEGM